MRWRCSREGRRKRLQRVKRWKHQTGNNNSSGSEFIESERMRAKWKEGTMIGEEQENELSTCQRIKASSCHILTRSHTHSPQCLNLMSQEPLSGSRIQQHPHTACVIDNLSPCTAAFLFLFSVITTCTLHIVVLPAHWLSPWAKAKSLLIPHHRAFDRSLPSIGPYRIVQNMRFHRQIGPYIQIMLRSMDKYTKQFYLSL